MTIIEAIENKFPKASKESDNDKKNRRLWDCIKDDIIPNIINHNKNIISQMYYYDIHDEEHSKKIIEIEEKLIGEKIKELSFCELLLLYLSAYIHDSAMALPIWEYKALEAVEGTRDCSDNSIKFSIKNDLKPVQKYSEVKKLICENKHKIFNFDDAKYYIFAPSIEEDIIKDIVDIILEYEDFRSGFYDELKEKLDNTKEYIEYSKGIRTKFIRVTHHKRVEKNVKRLTKKIEKIIGKQNAKKFTCSLARICRAHGEDFIFIEEKLLMESIDYNNEKYNEQFIAILLRLGDIIHFDNNRAPISLFAEKQIEDQTSKIHWNAKEQELKYNINSDGDSIVIKYSAYCENPKTYYFIQDYIDGIDKELSNYYYIRKNWKSKKIEKYRYYDLSLVESVDRTGLDYNSDVFKPDREMKFTLNQSQTFELLMGSKLYKDSLLCLRELYQNALDSSKCMRAHNLSEGIEQNLPIVFGLGKDFIEGSEQEYIYCLDRGMGMNNYVIKNYLLKIGTSYYKSADFMKENAKWNFGVIPTSQFGIGLLSGYMLANKIGITSVYWENKETISCVIKDKESSYYNEPKREDLEKIGNHGTLVKLYLKPEYSEVFNNNFSPRLPLLLMKQKPDFCEAFHLKAIDKNNLQFILFNQIGITETEIPLLIENNEGQEDEVFSAITIFDYRNYPEIKNEDFKNVINKNYLYIDEKTSRLRENIEYYVVEAETENMRLYSHIALPSKISEFFDEKFFCECCFLGEKEGSIYVDGVYVGEYENIIDGDGSRKYFGMLASDIMGQSILNFIGTKRPQLSVDRNSITSLAEFKNEFNDLKINLTYKLLEIIKRHIKEKGNRLRCSELILMFDNVIQQYPSLSIKFIQRLIKEIEQGETNKELLFDKALQKCNITFSDLFHKSDIYFDKADLRYCHKITKYIIFLRLLSANSITVNDDLITITDNEQCLKFSSELDKISGYTEIYIDDEIIVKADKWEGEYSEYDMVSSLWPIVSPDLYNRIDSDITEMSDSKVKIINENHQIISIANFNEYDLEGIVYLERGVTHIEKLNYISLREHFPAGFTEKFNNKVLYVFYNPVELNNVNPKCFHKLRDKYINYVKCLTEGFSVLYIMDNKKKYIIRAGKMTKNEMLKQVPESFWEDGVIYYDMKNKIVHDTI